MKFITAYIYNSPLGNCGGIIPSNTDHVYLPHERGNWTLEQIQERGEDHLIMEIEQRGSDYWAVKAAFPPASTKDCIGPMAGGRLVYSSDSRCARVYHLHDRYETQEVYNVMSR